MKRLTFWATSILFCSMHLPLAWAASIVPLGVLDEDQPFSDLRAVSPNGQYAVGGSRNADGLVTPFLWSQSTGIIGLDTGGFQGWATGVDVRPAVDEIVIAGQIGGPGARLHASLAGIPLSGWIPLAGSGWPSDYNSLATVSNGDKYYISGYVPSCSGSDRGYRYRGSTALDDYWITGSTGDTRLEAVSSTGVVVGHNSAGLSGSAPIWSAPPAAYSTIPAENPWQDATATGVSGNGAWLTGTSARDGQLLAFRWAMNSGTAEFLTTPVGFQFAQSMDCSDQGIVIGSAAGADGIWQAVLWDDTGLWGTSAGPVLISDRLASLGVDLRDWASLTSANSISSDGRVIGGSGIWAADGSTRGWLAVLPEPGGTMLILAGALLLPRRRIPRIQRK